MGWTFPWASSFGGDFNSDFSVYFTESSSAKAASNTTTSARAARSSTSRCRRRAGRREAAMTGTDVATYTRERPGMSAFVLEDGMVYHTYSAYARGLDGLWGMYQWLDRAPKGRNETGIGSAATTSTTSVEPVSATFSGDDGAVPRVGIAAAARLAARWLGLAATPRALR